MIALLIDILIRVALPVFAIVAMIGWYEWKYYKKRTLEHRIHISEMQRLHRKHARIQLVILLYKLGITQSTRKLL